MKKTFIAISLVILVACGSVKTKTASSPENQDHLILATLWYQRSAEMRALYLQCYHNAETALAENIKKSPANKPFAVVMDIDETVLDNSPFQGWQVLEKKPFSDAEWNRWVSLSKAEALPGAVEFTRFADSLGVDIYYISNRKTPELEATLKNMTALGFANADASHMLFKTETSSKINRRSEVEKTHEIVLLVGDNLADLDAVFEKRPDNFGMSNVDSLKNRFGTRYIVLPNPMYGNWLSEILKQTPGATDREKLLKRIQGF